MSPVEDDADFDRRQSNGVQLDGSCQVGFGELVTPPQIDALSFEPFCNRFSADAELLG